MLDILGLIAGLRLPGDIYKIIANTTDIGRLQKWRNVKPGSMKCKPTRMVN